MNEAEIFIAGANGQLGKALRARYPNANFADIDRLDITEEESIKNYDWSQTRIILNAAAYTNVDGAETAEGRIEAWKVNAHAVGYLSKVARDNDITILHISTDYVFDGTQDNHKEEEAFAPLSVYGASKAAGDIIVSLTPKFYILRTSWVIGEGRNFVRTMLELGKKGVDPTVVSDQIGRLTFTSELVRAIDHLLSNNLSFGTYNISNSGESKSWADITKTIFEIAGYQNSVNTITTDDYYTGKENTAPRPLNSTLNLTKIQTTSFTSTDWRDELRLYIEKELQS
ncbi:NAD(P)-dependent oxidoreductase [Candidatus Saccharibacteria bacterium]|nr:NAD(P)-dependent oxidoreductase [Candidatus Saccharibacteria bacterium]